MKKILSIIVTIAAVTMFTACGSDDASYQATPVLEVSASDVLFEADGGDGYINLNTNSAVSAVTDASWLTLSVVGNVVTVTANPNLSLDGRSAVIKLSAGGTETTVTATQKSSIYGVPGLEYEIGDYQASLDIPVVHNQEVTVESNDEWLTAVWNEETNQIEIVAEDNDEEEPRVGTITITMGDYSDEITITQKGFLLEVAEDEVVAKKNAALSKYGVDVEHSRAVNVTTEDEWITATFDNSKNQVVINAEANDGAARIGHVTVTSGPVTKVITVMQYDFMTELDNMFYLYYRPTATGSWTSIVSMIDVDTPSLIFLFNNNQNYMWSIPLEIDEENEKIYAGPCSSFVGAYDVYNIYLVFRSTAGYWSAYTNFTSVAEGEVTFEEDEDGLYTFIEWGGTFGTNNIDAWGLRAMHNHDDYDGTFSSANNAGYLASYYFPTMEKIVPDEGGEAKALLQAAKK